MSSTMKDLVMGEAELDSEEDDESFDEETGEARERERDRGKHIDDSSEEEEDDDDEEEMAKVREGFIVDEDEEEDEAGADSDEQRKKRKRKRRQEREEEAQLDEEDLDLIGENNDGWDSKQAEKSKFKRLKRGHREEEVRGETRLDDIFSDEEDGDAAEERPYARPSHRGAPDEMEDFIEDDYLEDEEDRIRAMEDREVARPRDRGLAGTVGDTAGLDEEVREDMLAIFGDGDDYAWALEMEEEEETRQKEEQTLELKDVFEPSQLAEKLLTEEDNIIRFIDEPERFQLDRKPFRASSTDHAENLKEEARWITTLMWPQKGLSPELQQPFQKAVGKVLEYFVLEEVEVPYVFQHRKDYLIHARRIRNPERRDDPDAPEFISAAEKMITQDDLWRILELDIKFRSLVERRNNLQRNIDNLREQGVQDEILSQLTSEASSMEELQDLQDYLSFQYGAELKDIAAVKGLSKETKRPGAKSSTFERIRKSRAYQLVKAFGITPDRLAQNALREGQKVVADDDEKLPIDLADSLVDTGFPTGEQVLYNARQMYAEELFMSPRMRKHFRIIYYAMGEVSCHRTEKGLRRIDDSHPYYEIKYLINQTLADFVRRPELFLKMMRAEEEGLIEISLKLQNEREFRRQLLAEFVSENQSENADAWNEERRKVLDVAFTKLERIIVKGVKDTLKTACQEEVLKACRDEYSRRLDQAPYKPKGMVIGTTPRVLTISNGMGDPARDPVFWTFLGEDGRVAAHGQIGNLARDEGQREALVDLIESRNPDVIGVSGYSSDTHKLIRDLESLVHDKGILGPFFDDEAGEERRELMEILVVNDEVARLYKDSPRALAENATLNSLTRYCAALGRYLQDPLKEYAALGKDVISLLFHPCQNLLPQDKLLKTLETAMVDMVNLVGVNINDAVSDAYIANLLPYVAGLGPRKATSVLKAIANNGGVVKSREELVGDPDNNKMPVVGPRIWMNCASFLYIDYEPSTSSSEPLDNTRVHPEDYELGRKMAADALELDEEDVKAETDEHGAGAVVRKLMKEEEQEKVNDLILEEYAEQLEKNFNQKKRATLETIRGELQSPYEELRHFFSPLTADQIFVMLTGETKDSLAEGMLIPVNVRVVKEEFAIVKLDCGIEGRIEAHDVTHRPGASIRDVLHQNQTIQAKLIDVNRKDFQVKLSSREDMVKRPYRKPNEHDRGTWDYKQEEDDQEALREKDRTTGRAQRVIKHPLFKPFNATEAEQYLGSQANGDVVIRPSSKGNDHLAITWKVADGVFQHVDVLELQKETEFSVGRQLRIGGKYQYSDLDELIVDHVKAMARKVEELMASDKFRKGSHADLEKWLTAYSDANPTKSSYAFCIDPKHPGYFYLSFKASKGSKIGSWFVKVVPNAFEMMKSQYPDMRALCNGFKLRFQSEMSKIQRR